MDATKLLQSALNDAGLSADVKLAMAGSNNGRAFLRYEYVQADGVPFHDVASEVDCVNLESAIPGLIAKAVGVAAHRGIAA